MHISFSTFIIHASMTASADALTDGPGAMHGNVGLRTTSISASDSLIESEQSVGARSYSQTHIELYGEFSPIKHLSVAFSVPYINERYSFTGVSEMEFDPATKSGSYINSAPAGDFERNGSGIGGSTIGLFFYPFHDRLFEKRADRGSWKVGVQYRLPSSQHFYTTREDGSRGAGPGAGAWNFYGAFSTPSKVGTPYTEIKATYAGVWMGPIRNDNGEEILAQGEIRPPSRLSLRVGNAITVWEDTAFAHFVEFDVYGRGVYDSWADVTTGILLPSTLSSYDDFIVNRSEVLQLTGGMGVNAQYNSYYSGRAAFEIGMMSPQAIEHIYPISTDGSVVWSVMFDLRFRYRTTAT